MKHVVKRPAPQSLLDWKAQANEDWNPSYDKLQNPEKRALQTALLVEQGQVCCYCGSRVDLDSSHIEHFRPQETRPDLELEFSNLHASCLRQTGPGLPLHCGHAKGPHFNEALAVSPLEPDCEARFTYGLDGTIDGTDQGAEYMVTLLALSSPILRRRREQALVGVFDDILLLEASEKELRLLATGYRRRDEQGLLPDLGHVIARYAEQLL